MNELLLIKNMPKLGHESNGHKNPFHSNCFVHVCVFYSRFIVVGLLLYTPLNQHILSITGENPSFSTNWKPKSFECLYTGHLHTYIHVRSLHSNCYVCVVYFAHFPLHMSQVRRPIIESPHTEIYKMIQMSQNVPNNSYNL